ncbi:MAG TPA: OmpA family protein [Longimicrobium sp.]
MTMLSRKLAVFACVGTLGMSGVSGCASLNRTEQGAVVGAGTGAAVGAVIGKQTGSTARGAILGAVLGGAAGAVIGRRMDNQAQELERSLPQAEVQRVGEGIAVTFASGILFPFNSTQVLPAGQSNLAQLAQSLQRYPETTVLIVGHTDNVGSDAYNMGLSQNRAQSAANYLAAQGIARNRVRIEGRGESEPIASNETESGRAQNRRVEIAIFASEQYRQQILGEYGNRNQ